MTLRDWTEEVCAVLDIDADVDQALILDLARVAAHSVQRPAAPLTTFLVGYAAGLRGGDAKSVELLAAKAQALAEKWAEDSVDMDGSA